MKMKLLDMFIKEYLLILKGLENKQPIENNRIMVDKSHFRELLERYNYIGFNQKTKLYKKLGFILHDNKSYTLPCKDKELNKTVRKVVFDYDVYTTIKYLNDTELDLEN